MRNEIEELIKILQKEKFKIILTNDDSVIKMKKSTLCDRLINLLKIVEEKYE